MSKRDMIIEKECAEGFLESSGSTKEQIEKIIKGAIAWQGSGIKYIEDRLRESDGDVTISHSEYELATGGRKMFDAVVIRARKQIPRPGELVRTTGAPYGTATRFILYSSDEGGQASKDEINQAILAERERINACIDHMFDGLSDELVALSRSLKMAVNERYSTKS